MVRQVSSEIDLIAQGLDQRWMPMPSLPRGMVFVHGNKNGSPVVLDEEHQELCWLGVAGVSTDQVNVVWILIERLSGMKSHFLAPFHLHYDRAFEHIDKAGHRFKPDRGLLSLQSGSAVDQQS